MNRQILFLSVLSVAVSACSGVNNHKQASGDFEYAKRVEAKHIAVPEGLKKPKLAEDFFITNDINHKGPIGAKVDVRAPSLVLPIAASSRVEQNSDAAKVWFDQVLDDRDLQLFIYQAIQEQLEGDGTTLNTLDAENKIFQSEWINNTTESGHWTYDWLFDSVDTAESMRFQFQIETKPHGRSVALMVSLLDYMRTDQTGATKEIDVIDKQRAEMAMLNKIIAQVDYKYRLAQQENRLMRANQQLVTLGDNAKGEAAYVIEMELEALWSNMPIFFEDYGFSIADLDESKKFYLVDFKKPDVSFWDSIWGDEAPVVELTDARYKFDLTQLEDKTLLTIYDDQDKALSKEMLENIHNVMGPALSFRNVF